VAFSGVLPEPLSLLEGRVRLEPGAVTVRLEWLGGPVPAIETAALDAEGLCVDDTCGRTLAVAPGHATVDGVPLPVPRVDHLLDELIDHVHDLAVHAEAHSERDLLVKVAAGVEATLPAQEPVVVRGVTTGPPSQPLLDAPLVVTVGGTGVRVSHRRLQWLSSLARVRLQEARLHPDGKVALHAGAAGRRLRSLDRVSDRLSEVVRRSPRFARVRAFLRQR